MYPPVKQFETRRLELEELLTLVARRRAADVGVRSKSPLSRLRSRSRRATRVDPAHC
jgi:hypothetical protein